MCERETQRLDQSQEDAVRAEIGRLLESPAFRTSKRCREFLEYIVEHTMNGSNGALKERSLGVALFQLPQDFDTGQHTIVRVTANEVRKRLAQFYQEFGAGSDPTITLPPGSYAVAFRWKPSQEDNRPLVSAPLPGGRRRRLLLAGAFLLLGALTAIAMYGTHGSQLDLDPHGRAADDAFWSRIFGTGQKTNIIMADAARYEIQELLARDMTLRDYLSPEYPTNLLPAISPNCSV